MDHLQPEAHSLDRPNVVLRAIPPTDIDQAERRRAVEAVAGKLREVGWECDVIVSERQDPTPTPS